MDDRAGEINSRSTCCCLCPNSAERLFCSVADSCQVVHIQLAFIKCGGDSRARKGNYIFQGKTGHQRLRFCDSYVVMSLRSHSFLPIFMLLVYCNLLGCTQIGWYCLKFCALVTAITHWLVKPKVVLMSENLVIQCISTL